MSGMFQTLDEVPWNSGAITAVVAPSGELVGLDSEGFAIWKTGTQKGRRIPLDANGPWLAFPGKVTVLPDGWSPSTVGELFMVITSNRRTLMRVTEIASETSWRATAADLDEAASVTGPLPAVFGAGEDGMSWIKITCEERDAIYYAERPEELRPISSCTDMSGEFHGEPQMDITWGIASTGTPVLRELRYPSRDGGPDRQPCEHWQFQDDGW